MGKSPYNLILSGGLMVWKSILLLVVSMQAHAFYMAPEQVQECLHLKNFSNLEHSKTSCLVSKNPFTANDEAWAQSFDGACQAFLSVDLIGHIEITFLKNTGRSNFSTRLSAKEVQECLWDLNQGE
jgi:hypothetical protein